MEVSETQKIIADATGKVSALAAIPVPVLDVASMTFFQYQMVTKLAKLYHLKTGRMEVIVISSILSSLISKLISIALERLASTAKLDKMLKDSLIRASVSGFFTTVIGEVYNLHFKSGGTLEDLTLHSFVAYFESQFKSDRWSLSGLTDDFMKGIEQFKP